MTGVAQVSWQAHDWLRDGLDFLSRTVGHGDFSSFVAEEPAFQVRESPPPEVFTSALILCAMDDARLRCSGTGALVDKVASSFSENGFVHFFEDRALLPADLDCTALALLVAREHRLRLKFDVSQLLSQMANCVDERGVVRVYFTDDPVRQQRLDPVVCVNTLYAFALFGRERELEPTMEFVEEFLSSGSCLEGTRYYPTPEVFLMFLSRLVARFDFARERFGPWLLQAVGALAGRENRDPVALACRIAAAKRVGLMLEDELFVLRAIQQRDGAWRAAPCFCYGRTARWFGGEALSTALALSALASPLIE